MALKARDSKHQNQITAGTTGRLLGHSFEKTLSENINKYANGQLRHLKPLNSNSHLNAGVPEQILIQYIINKLKLENIESIKSFWLGGLATSGQGDILDIFGNGKSVKRSKSDILIEFTTSSGIQRVGVSVKTCNKEKPTNAQLFCSTARAFCELLRSNDIPVSLNFEKGLMMFCGDAGFRPLDDNKKNIGRKSDPERWFFEELPLLTRLDIENTIKKYQDEITRALLQLAYRDDPCPPDFVFHQTKKADDPTIFVPSHLIGDRNGQSNPT